MRRTKEEAAHTREEIFRAGIQVFAGKGYAAATMNDIARKAGVTRGAIYWHFSSKEAFFQETLARLNRAYDALIDMAQHSDQSPLDAITTAVERLIGRFVVDEEFRAMQELVVRITMSGGNIPVGERPIERGGETALHYLSRAMTNGDLFDEWPAEVALNAMAAYLTGVFLMIADGGFRPNQEEISALARFVRRGMAPACGAADVDPKTEYQTIPPTNTPQHGEDR